MEDYRSRSCKDGRMQYMDSYDEGKAAPPTSMQDLRCYSANYAGYMGKELKIKKVKSSKDHQNGHHGSSSSSSKSWSFSDPELQRKKRVASYKVYAVEGKMKGSLRKSFKWIKNTCTHVVYGWR